MNISTADKHLDAGFLSYQSTIWRFFPSKLELFPLVFMFCASMNSWLGFSFHALFKRLSWAKSAKIFSHIPNCERNLKYPSWNWSGNLSRCLYHEQNTKLRRLCIERFPYEKWSLIFILQVTYSFLISHHYSLANYICSSASLFFIFH